MSERQSGTTELAESYVVSSEVTIAADSADILERAFKDRLHLVEQAPGFQRLEVWRDLTQDGVFQMVSWWDDVDSFRTYMRSPQHRLSHARIPTEPDRPHATALRRYVQVPELAHHGSP
jgi:heme-degrading monooxygenase HmoA